MRRDRCGAILDGVRLMIFLTWASSIVEANGGKKGRARRRSSKFAVAVARLADMLFYRPAGLAGTAGRIGLLIVVAVISYFAGAGLGAVIMKAPLPAMLIIGAILFGYASSDPNVD